MSSQSPLRTRRVPLAASRSLSSRSLMDVPRLSLDALSLARALVHAAVESLAQLRARPRIETAVKGSGGVAAALLALKYAKSLRSACIVGLVAGVFAHSLYADVLRQKKPSVPAVMMDTTTPVVNAPSRRQSRAARVEESKEEETSRRLSRASDADKRIDTAV